MPINTKPEILDEPILEAEPVKRDYDNLDDLISEMANPKQQIGPMPSEGPGPQAGSSDPGTWEPPARQIVTGDDALRSGKRLAKTIDSGFSFLAGLYSKVEDPSKYKATEGDLNDLADPLAEISEKYNFNMSPEARLIFLLLTIYGPRTIQAINDKRIPELQNTVQQLELRIQKAESKLKEKEEKEDKEETKNA